MIDAAAYNIVVRKGDFEGEVCFEARVAELPDIAEYADTHAEAYALAIDTIEVTAEVLGQQGKAMPSPYVPADDFSGRVTLRIPKSLHRSLAQASDSEGVSLNQHMVNILSYYSGYANAMEADFKWEHAIPHAKKSATISQLKVISRNNLEPLAKYASR